MNRLAAASLLALCAACAGPVPKHPGGAATRIVSLMPSLTEDLCAIGAGPQLAAVSQYSEDIPCARGLPQVASFSSVNAEKIVALKPDAVVAIPAQRTLAAPLRRAGIPVTFLADDSYESIFADIRTLGELAGKTQNAQRLIARLQTETARLRASERFKRRPRVFFVEQAQPIWTVGPQSYISTLIELAGGTNAVRSLPSAYAQYSPEALLALQPDLIVAGGDARLETMLTREPWRSLRAVRAGRVYVLNDSALLVRPGPRYNEGLSWLIQRLRPSAN